MTVTLLDFQQEAFEKLKDVSGILLADDPGLGKTYQAIARDLYLRSTGWSGKTLVIAPSTVMSVWEEHYRTFDPNIKVVVVDPKKRAKSWKAFVDLDADVFILHWAGVRLMKAELGSFKWLHIIADECHNAKNRKAQQTVALKRILTFHKSGLSGTPADNYPADFWSILNWLYPSKYRSYWQFYANYVDYEIVYPQGFHKIVGVKNVEQLHAEIDHFYVRRLKKDVLKDLPDKYYSDVWVDLEPVQRRAYDQMKKELLAWVGEHESKPLPAPVVIAQLIRLQQFAVAYADISADGSVTLAEPSSKLDVVMQRLEESHDEQIVVFTQFKGLVRLLETRLDKARISHVKITGDVPQVDRAANIEAFQSGSARVFVGTIQAGGVGITLTAASTAIFLDRTWSPAINSQAEDRLHRIGQKNAVEIIDVMARNTVDLGRRQRLEQKWAWLREILGDTD